MPNSNSNSEHRRISTPRREDDRSEFASCPKYIKHDISEEQVLAIAKRAVVLAREDQDREIGRLTKKGFFYILGAIMLGVYSWAVAHGFIEIKH